MLSAEETLRRLAIGDRTLLATIADLDVAMTPNLSVLRLDPRPEALVRLAALVALDAPQSAYSSCAETAFLAGATLDDLVATLLAVAGHVGSARASSAAPQIALAAGYDLEAALMEAGTTPSGS